MPQDINNTTDAVALNPTGTSGGALVATDLVSIDGNAATHVQYVKIGWGATGDQFYSVGTDTGTIGTSKPLPIMLRHTDGTAVNAANNKLDINLAGHGITLHADISHRALSPALFVQGTAGMRPLVVEGTRGATAVWVAATAGFGTSGSSALNTIPSVMFGITSAGGIAPVGITGDRMLVDLDGEIVTVKSDNSSGLFVTATGGFTGSTAEAGAVRRTTPSVMFGVTAAGGIEPVGITNGRMKVFLEDTVTVTQVLGGTSDAGGVLTQPSLIYGASGPSAAAIGVSGPADKPRLLVDLAGERVALDADSASTHSGLYVRGTGGFTGSTAEAKSILRTTPAVIFGVTAAGGIEPIASSGGRLQVEVGAATCITFDVSVNPFHGVYASTGDGGKMNRAVQIMGITHDSLDLGAYPPVVVSGKLDGGTYPYPIGITTAGVAGSGGQWHLLVTGGVEVTKFSVGTLTVSATDLDIRGLVGTGAPGAKDLVEVVGGSGDGPVFVRATGGLGHRNIPVHNTMPSLLYGITGAASASGGLSAGAVGITGADMLHVGIGHPVAIDASATNPLRVQATGGLSAGSGNNARLPLDVTVPSLLMGLSSGSDVRAAPVGMSADMIKVDIAQGISAGRDSMGVFAKGGVLGLCGAADNAVHNTLPVLMMGISAGAGNSAAPIGMSGDALNVNMVNAGITVDVTVGTSVEVSNDTGGPLYIAGASGASGSEGLLPVTVAGNYQGTAVFVQGTGGMSAVEVRGFSGSGNDLGVIPIGVSSGNNWRMASDANLDSIGVTLDKTYKMFIAALGGDLNGDDLGAEQFATKSQMDAMSPNGDASTTRIANAADMSAAKINLDTIAGAVTSEPGQDISGGKQMQVDIIDILQPDGFTAGQIALVSGSATQVQTESNPSAGFTLDSGIKLKAHQDNTNFIYIGNSAVSSTNGFPLGPSEEIFIEISNLSKLYGISSTASGLTLCYIGS